MRNEKMYWTTVLEGVEWLRKFNEANAKKDRVRELIHALDSSKEDYWTEKNYQEGVLKDLDKEQSQFAYAIEALANLVGKLFGVRYDDYQQEIHKQLNIQEADKRVYPSLTDLEKEVIRGCLAQGFAYDWETDRPHAFICWGVTGKRERGALASLEKKGVFNIEVEGKDTQVFAGSDWTVEDLEKMSHYER